LQEGRRSWEAQKTDSGVVHAAELGVESSLVVDDEIMMTRSSPINLYARTFNHSGGPRIFGWKTWTPNMSYCLDIFFSAIEKSGPKDTFLKECSMDKHRPNISYVSIGNTGWKSLHFSLSF
jgi:hypothetical protein